MLIFFTILRAKLIMPASGKNIKLLLVLLLPAYFFIGYSSILNKHTHFYANGIIVTHSHPVKKGNGTDVLINKHNHSSSDICFFYPTQSDKYIIRSVTQIEYKPTEIPHRYPAVNKVQISSEKFRKVPPRSPPV
jgi:hypothetical protein